MKLGILFPVAIFIIAVVFLGWFLSAAMRRRVGHNEKAPLSCWSSPSWRWPAPSWLVVIAAAILRSYPIPSIS